MASIGGRCQKTERKLTRHVHPAAAPPASTGGCGVRAALAARGKARSGQAAQDGFRESLRGFFAPGSQNSPLGKAGEGLLVATHRAKRLVQIDDEPSLSFSRPDVKLQR